MRESLQEGQEQTTVDRDGLARHVTSIIGFFVIDVLRELEFDMDFTRLSFVSSSRYFVIDDGHFDLDVASAKR
jgi:hypothetical protein